MDSNSVSPMPGELAPIAEFDKSPPTPPDEEVPLDDLPPPPSAVPDPEDCKLPAISDAWGLNGCYDEEESKWSRCKMCEYVFILVSTIVLLGGSFGLMFYWVMKYRGGVLWDRQTDNDNLEKYQNLHFLFMSSGFVTCGGLSIMMYRILRCCPKGIVKLIHFLLHCATAALVGFGLKVTWDYHTDRTPPLKHFYSLHSWIGIVTVGIFVLQFLVGFVSFVLLAFMKSADGYRAKLAHVHAAFGLVTFVLAVTTCCTALHRYGIDFLKESYTEWSEEGIIVNVIGILFIILAILISYSVRRPPAQHEAKVFVTERL